MPEQVSRLTGYDWENIICDIGCPCDNKYFYKLTFITNSRNNNNYSKKSHKKYCIFIPEIYEKKNETNEKRMQYLESIVLKEATKFLAHKRRKTKHKAKNVCKWQQEDEF